MSTKFLSPGWRMPRNANQSKSSNYSMYGDATGEINIADAPLSSESWTIAVWLKPSVTTGTEIIWDMQYGSAGGFKLIHQYGTSSTTAVWFQYYAPTYSNFGSQVTITPNNWHHVIVRYNKGVDYRIYVDGVFSGSSTTFNNYSYPTTRDLEIFKIGGFNGNLDQFCIFNYALSDTSTTVGDTATGQVASLWGGGTEVSNPMALPSPPVAYYPLGESAGGFVGGSGTWLTENNAIGDYVFDFITDDYISFGNNSVFQPSSNYTFSIWFKYNSSSSVGIFSTNSSVSSVGGVLAYINGTTILYYHASDVLLINNIPSTNEWINLTVTWSSSTGIVRSFINGKYKSQLTGKTSMTWGNDLIVGKYKDSSMYFDGELSNFVMWDTTLTDGFSGTPTAGDVAGEQVAEVYNNGIPQTTVTGTPVGWWKLDASATYDGSNWTIPDDSTNSNTGTSSGMTQANLVQSDLSFTSGYSPYALEFDGTNDYIDLGTYTQGTGLALNADMSISAWIKTSNLSSTQVIICNLNSGASSGGYCIEMNRQGNGQYGILYNGATVGLQGSTILSSNTWYHIVMTRTGTSGNWSYNLYLNGNSDGSATNVAQNFGNGSVAIGRFGAYNGGYFNGYISNVSIWNAALTSSQVTEIYNEGVPSNLNNHSAYSNLVSWWQLGSNSSFNTNWTVLDEKGTNNGTSTGMGVDALTNGVGTIANGTSTGMAVGALVGNAPYSTANAISSGMSVVSRVTGSGNTP